MLKLLHDLKSQWHTCSLCTQQELNRANFMREEMWFSNLFDRLYISAEIWYGKTEEQFFLEILNTSWFSANQTFFIDDKEVYCKPASALWIQTFHFQDNIDALRNSLIQRSII